MRERLKGFLVICTSAVELIAEAWEEFFSAACTHAHGEVCMRQLSMPSLGQRTEVQACRGRWGLL